MSLIVTQLTERALDVMAQLESLWESSVRATHDFLTEDDIKSLKLLVRQGLQAIPLLCVAEDSPMNRSLFQIMSTKILSTVSDCRQRITIQNKTFSGRVQRTKKAMLHFRQKLKTTQEVYHGDDKHDPHYRLPQTAPGSGHHPHQ